MCTYMQCPDTLVPQDELWPDTSMSLVNNNIIIYDCVHKINWWKHKHVHVELLLAKRSEMWLFNYC